MKRTVMSLLAFASATVAWQRGGDWLSHFPVEKNGLTAAGANRYFILTPGHTLWYQDGTNTLITTVLNETKIIDGVVTRIVEDREAHGGQLVEVSRDYYAIDRNTKDVYYFGEDVDEYRKGKVVGHGGAWLSGVGGARFGLMMPGAIRVGARFYQEHAPGVAMDRAEVVGAAETVTTPAGTFRDCIRVRETNPLENGPAEYKWYAPGVGMVKEGREFVLLKWLPGKQK